MIYYKSKSDSVMCRLNKNSGMVSVQNNITKSGIKLRQLIYSKTTYKQSTIDNTRKIKKDML